MRQQRVTMSDSERVEKTAGTMPGGVEYGQFRTELELLAVDSLPILDKSTVRVEDVTRTKNDQYEVTISGVPRDE